MQKLRGRGEPRESARLRDDLVRVPLKSPTLPPATRTNMWLVDTGDGWLVIDPASADEASIWALDQAVKEHARGWSRVRGALLTHHHPDHIGGAQWWVAHSGLPLYCHATTPALDPRVPESAVPVEGGGRLGEALLEYTPGHASDHMALHLPLGGVIAGDLVTGLGSVVVNPPDGNLSDYLETLERWRDEPPEVMFPSHGWEFDDPEEHLSQLLAHRNARLDAVMAALRRGGELRLDEIVAAAWNDVPKALLPLAARTARAHIDHLERAGRVVALPSSWKIGAD